MSFLKDATSTMEVCQHAGLVSTRDFTVYQGQLIIGPRDSLQY